MQIYDVTISSQGQVTVPVAIRRLLGLHKGDKVRFIAEDGGVRVVAAPWTLESVIGSVVPPCEAAAIDDIIDEAMDDDVGPRVPEPLR
ncbi:MAG: AbrB/MazE/SpoVT family DNA-binding domain-containing protein [Chloroflexota bacterium]